ncbi:MAG: stage III sporulation protein AD [Oscillospiraceae bacterium]|nr:stage III sporulation protein AD [Oscillospiraceae bacterium]
MGLILKAVAIALSGAVLGLVIKKHMPDTALLLSLAVCCAVTGLALELISDIVEFVKELFELTELKSAEGGVVLKTVGIAIAAKLGSSICSEAGQAAAAVSVELAGAAAAVYVALPLMRTVIDMVRELL